MINLLYGVGISLVVYLLLILFLQIFRVNIKGFWHILLIFVIAIPLIYLFGKWFWDTTGWWGVGSVIAVIVLIVLSKYVTLPSFQKKGSDKEAKKTVSLKITLNGILFTLLTGLAFFIAFTYLPELRFWEPKAKTITFRRVYSQLNTEGGANEFQSDKHRLQYEIKPKSEYHKGYDIFPKEHEWVIVRYEKYNNDRVSWEVAYGWKNGKLVTKNLSSPPSDGALVGKCLVSVIKSSTGYPATLYVEEVY